MLKLHRTPDVSKQGDIVVARRNPEALWISGYEDRIIYDGRNDRGNQFAPLLEMISELTSDTSPNSFKEVIGDELFRTISKAAVA